MPFEVFFLKKKKEKRREKKTQLASSLPPLCFAPHPLPPTTRHGHRPPPRTTSSPQPALSPSARLPPSVGRQIQQSSRRPWRSPSSFSARVRVCGPSREETNRPAAGDGRAHGPEGGGEDGPPGASRHGPHGLFSSSTPVATTQRPTSCACFFSSLRLLFSTDPRRRSKCFFFSGRHGPRQGQVDFAAGG